MGSLESFRAAAPTYTTKLPWNKNFKTLPPQLKGKVRGNGKWHPYLQFILSHPAFENLITVLL